MGFLNWQGWPELTLVLRGQPDRIESVTWPDVAVPIHVKLGKLVSQTVDVCVVLCQACSPDRWISHKITMYLSLMYLSKGTRNLEQKGTQEPRSGIVFHAFPLHVVWFSSRTHFLNGRNSSLSSFHFQGVFYQPLAAWSWDGLKSCCSSLLLGTFSFLPAALRHGQGMDWNVVLLLRRLAFCAIFIIFRASRIFGIFRICKIFKIFSIFRIFQHF